MKKKQKSKMSNWFLFIVLFISILESKAKDSSNELKVYGAISWDLQVAPDLPTLLLTLENKGADDISIDLEKVYEVEKFFTVRKLKTKEEMGHSPAGSAKPPKYGKITLSPKARIVLVVACPYNLIFLDHEVGFYSLEHSSFGLIIPKFEVSEKTRRSK